MPAAPDLPLADIHLPPPAGWWPPAVGWWVLVLLLLAVSLWAMQALRRYWCRRRRARAVLAAFDAAMAQPCTPAQQIAELSALLRRAAALVAPQAAMLADVDWLRWLDGDDPAQPFSRGPGCLLLTAPYRPGDAAVDPDEFAALRRLARARIARWMRQGHV